MKQSRGSNYYANNLAFIDMLFNIIVVITLLYILSTLLINPPKAKEVEAKADLLVVLTWADNNPNDVDLWVKPADGANIGYVNKENTYVFLERDDRGASNNFYFDSDNVRQEIPTRREVMSFRGRPPGRFVTNVFFFRSSNAKGDTVPYTGEPLPVKVELIQINPTYKILATKDIILDHVGQEETAFSFIINGSSVEEINTVITEHFVTQPTQ